MKRKGMIILALFGTVVLTGCTTVNSQARSVIDANASNAAAISTKAQADAALPDYAKKWFKSEADSWSAMSAWAAGKQPTPAVNH